MTGYYVRVERDDGKFESLEIDQLTEAEMDRFIKSQLNRDDFGARGWVWVKCLAGWIRDNVKGNPDVPDNDGSGAPGVG
jgi:hypothetical protein